MGVVRKSKHIMFILSNNIFQSEWCKQELMAALAAKVEVILVVYAGASWEGASFPPDKLVPAELKPAFMHKGESAGGGARGCTGACA